eukprot:42338-Eustigmatos_ZCMA.PRE.1
MFKVMCVVVRSEAEKSYSRCPSRKWAFAVIALPDDTARTRHRSRLRHTALFIPMQPKHLEPALPPYTMTHCRGGDHCIPSRHSDT